MLKRLPVSARWPFLYILELGSYSAFEDNTQIMAKGDLEEGPSLHSTWA